MAEPRVRYTGGSGGSTTGRVRYTGGSGTSAPARARYTGQSTSSGGGGGGILGGIEKGAGLVGNLAKDVGSTALGLGPAAVTVGKAGALDVKDMITFHGSRPSHLTPIAKQTVQGYKDYYGHDLAHHIYTHPLQPIVDALTIADLGAGALTKAGVLKAGRADLVTRSPRAIATGKGPVHTEISSAKPFIRGREKIATAARTKRPEGTLGVGGEVKHYGKQIQQRAGQHAMENLAPHGPYVKATKGLSKDEWTALHVRAMDIHPDDLRTLWKGTPKAAELTPKVTELALSPSKRMRVAEPAAKALSKEGEDLLKRGGKLTEETAAARPEKTKLQAAETLGHPVKPITGEPYYFPHVIEPGPAVSPLAITGGGKGVPRRLGSTKENTGALALGGKLHLRSDVLGPEFLRRVKLVKYDEIHKGLVRGAIRVSAKQINEQWGGRLPKGYEYVREKASTKIPATLRAQGETHVPLDKLIPNAEDLHGSALAEGFSTTNPEQALKKGGKYHIVPTSTVKAATGEFTRSSDFTRNFVQRPLKVWRSAVLGLRVGFLTNNLVGNSVMYAVKTGGNGALRHLFMAIREAHGNDVARKVLDSSATPPKLRADLTKEFFPEQVSGTFGRTQSPSTSQFHTAGQGISEAYRKVTSPIPRLTSKVAEEYPRRALVRYYIQNSPEFRQVYRALPKQTRTFESAARQILEGKGGPAYQRYISKQVNQALGDYLHLGPAERNVLRNILPFYSWYKAIATTTYHLAVDTPLRANILGQLGQIGKQQADSQVPSFLRGAIGLGAGPQGTQRVLSTQGMNPYATLEQLRRGVTGDYTALGLNPFIEGPAQYLQRRGYGNISPAALIASPLVDLLRNLPPSQLAFPPGPSKLYPTRKGRKTQILSNLGVPIKAYDPTVAAQQAAAGR